MRNMLSLTAIAAAASADKIDTTATFNAMKEYRAAILLEHRSGVWLRLR